MVFVMLRGSYKNRIGGKQNMNWVRMDEMMRAVKAMLFVSIFFEI